MTKISVVISAWNEESKIDRCLKSVTFADEIIFVDNQSIDKTTAIAKKYNVKLFVKENNPMLNINKNFGFAKASSEWILSLDADEEVTEGLAKEIRAIIAKETDIEAFWIPRKNIIFGKWIKHGLWWPDRQLRLFRKNKGKFPCKHVHEYLTVEGKTADLVIPYIHHNYETISQYIRKMDTLYTDSEVLKHWESRYQFAWHDAIRFPISDFIKIYFAQEGYKDGLHGLILAILQAFYAFVVFAKLWEKGNFSDIDLQLPVVEDEFTKSAKEMKYWIYTAQIGDAKNIMAKLWLKILRRLYASN